MGHAEIGGAQGGHICNYANLKGEKAAETFSRSQVTDYVEDSKEFRKNRRSGSVPHLPKNFAKNFGSKF